MREGERDEKKARQPATPSRASVCGEVIRGCMGWGKVAEKNSFPIPTSAFSFARLRRWFFFLLLLRVPFLYFPANVCGDGLVVSNSHPHHRLSFFFYHRTHIRVWICGNWVIVMCVERRVFFWRFFTWRIGLILMLFEGWKKGFNFVDFWRILSWDCELLWKF